MLFADFNPFKAPSFDAVMVLLILMLLGAEAMKRTAVKVVKKVDKDGKATEAAREGIVGWIIGKIKK